jgi:hypothetical protein
MSRSIDRFATHDGAPHQSLVEALEQLGAIISYEKEVGIRLFESKDKR